MLRFRLKGWRGGEAQPAIVPGASLLRESCLLPRIANQLDPRIPSPQLVKVDGAPAFMAYPILSGTALTRETLTHGLIWRRSLLP